MIASACRCLTVAILLIVAAASATYLMTNDGAVVIYSGRAATIVAWGLLIASALGAAANIARR